MTIEDWTPPPRDKVCLAIEGMLKWIEQDYGEGFEPALIRDILMGAMGVKYSEENMLFVLDKVALDWSK